MARYYTEQSLKKYIKSDLIAIIMEMVEEERSYEASFNYERERYRELNEEVKKLREKTKTSCSETEFAIVKAIRNHLAEAASYIDTKIENAVEEHNEYYHYNRSQEG